MQSTSKNRAAYQTFLLLFSVVLLSCITCFPQVALALEHRTLFLPFRINAPDATALAGKADRSLAQEVTAKGMKMVPRAQAEVMVDYKGAWPPSPALLSKIGAAAGAEYVVVGTLNKLGSRMSMDCSIIDVLSPKSPHTAYREGDSSQDMSKITGDIVGTMLAYSNRSAAIASIVPEGNQRVDSGAILQKISTKPGDIYDPAALREDLKAVFSMGYFDNVEIEAKDTPAGKQVVFHVKEKPLIGSVVINGADAVKEKDIRDAAGITANSILNPSKVNEAVQKIKDLYKGKGYYNTNVTAKISTGEDGKAKVEFNIAEQSKITIGTINFTGNKTFSAGDLEDVIQTSTHRWWISWLTDAGVLKKPILQQDAERIANFYQNHGFSDVRVGEPIIEQKDEELRVTFPIDEGPRYKIGKVDITGNLIKDKAAMLDTLKIRKEEYFNRQVLRDDITSLTDMYAEQGYAFAEVTPKVTKSETPNTMNVVLNVEQGSVTYINRVEIKGNTRTHDNVIRRDLSIKEGGKFDSKAIRNSTKRLNRLGFFEDVTITPKPTMVPNQMDVDVNVKEKPTGQFSIGAGYSSSEHVLFMGQISENNFLGTGHRVSLAASTSSKTTRFDLTYTDPRIMDSMVSGSVNLFDWKHEYTNFTDDSVGGKLQLGHPLFEKWRIYYGYLFKDTRLTDIDDNASQYIIQSENVRTESAVELSLVRDTFDKAFSPTEGSRNSVSVEYAGGPFAGDAQFTKVEGSSSWYFPLFWDLVFHVKGAAGQEFENETGKLPVYEHYFLGGMNSIRGFDSASISPLDQGDKIGGDKMWYGTVSFIHPLVKSMGLDIEIFHDFGNVYGTDQSWDFSDYKKTAGVGILWASPLGPLRLAWGFNLDKKTGEDSSNWDFSMGGNF